MSGNSPTKLQVLGQRSISSVILLAVLAGTVLSGSALVFIALCWLMCAVTGVEAGMMLKRSRSSVAWWLPVFFGVVYPPVLGFGMLYGGLGNWQAVAPALAAIVAFAWEMRRAPEGERALVSAGVAVLCCIYPVWMFSFIQEVLFRAPVAAGIDAGEVPGMWTALWVILVTKVTDIGAYLTGTLCGKHRMIPHISPKKTWEGFAGALVFAVGVGVAIYLWKPDYLASLPGVGVAAALALLLAVISVIGDLAGSLIKRSLGVKDSSNILPGIGGIFDLIDSPAFTLPVFVMLMM